MRHGVLRVLCRSVSWFLYGPCVLFGEMSITSTSELLSLLFACVVPCVVNQKLMVATSKPARANARFVSNYFNLVKCLETQQSMSEILSFILIYCLLIDLSFTGRVPNEMSLCRVSPNLSCDCEKWGDCGVASWKPVAMWMPGCRRLPLGSSMRYMDQYTHIHKWDKRPRSWWSHRRICVV